MVGNHGQGLAHMMTVSQTDTLLVQNYSKVLSQTVNRAG